MSDTSKKLKTLAENNEDFEWYPTTEEILVKVNHDLHYLFAKGNLADRHARNRREKLFSSASDYDRETSKRNYRYYIETFLDVGAGDGRVFDAIQGVKGSVRINRRYGIELAKAQANDLINRDIFIIGRDFWKTSLFDKEYSVIFSNPPYSQFIQWTEKLFREANFGVMYLVLPLRWQESIDKGCGIELFETKVLGEFDFYHADRSARARVNLIRITNKRRKVEDFFHGEKIGSHTEYGSDKEPDSFERWVNDNIGTFEKDAEESEDKIVLRLSGYEIPELVESFSKEAQALLDLFKSIGKTPFRILQAFNIDRKSVLEVIRENIKALKKRYWKIAFDRLSAINSRLTQRTRRELLNKMEEFNTLDFNEDNIYTIVIWVIKHFNEYTSEQILTVFDALTSQDYIKAYKSNVHWTKDNWRYTSDKGKPEKYRLDYRLVTHCYKRYLYDSNTVDDFIVICRSLGYYIHEGRVLNHEIIGSEQRFNTVDGTLAFTVRLYKNRNAHLKVNQKLMMKFNIEVARLRHWINDHKDIENEFDVSPIEAFKLWHNPGLRLLGSGDIKLLGFNNQPEEKSA